MKKTLTFLLFLFCMGSLCINTSAQDKDVLFLVDDAAALNLSDSVVRIAMENAGYDVTTMTGDLSVVGDTADVEIVVISSTLGSSTVRDKFKWIELPILNWENGAYDDFGMTNTDRGTETDDDKSIYIKDNSHPVASGLPTGVVKITSTGRFTTGTPYVSSDPAYAAEYFAALSEDTLVGTWFMYEVGDSLDPGTSGEDGFPTDGLAMGMRFGFPFEDNTFETPTPDAGTILLNSLDYALDGAIEDSIPVVYAYTLEDTLNIEAGTRVELTTNILPGNATHDADIQYSSMDESIVFVDTTGVVRGVGEGTAKVVLEANYAGTHIFKDTVVVNVTASDKPAVLFISDLNESDFIAAELMRKSGYIVNEVEDNDCVIEDTIAQDVIVISSSISSKYVRSTYHTSPLPILVWEEAAYDEFFMAKSTGSVSSDPQAINVVADSHPLASGFSAGSVVLGEPYSINYGNPYLAKEKSAIVIATIDTDKGAWFIYEKGDSASLELTGKDDFPADGLMYGMRIGLPFRNNTFETAYPEAATVLLNSVDYAIDGAIEATIPVADVKLSGPAGLSLLLGEDSTITASVFPSNATNSAITYSSSDEAIVTYVDGTVTAVAAGNAYIRAEADGIADSILVSVESDNTPSITLAGAEIEAEDFTFTTEVDNVYSWEIVGDTLAAGMSNGLAIQASPGDSVESFKDDYEMLAASSSYVVNFEEAGTYYFFFRGNSLASGDKNSFHLGVSNGADTTTFERVEMDQDIDTWQWTNTLKSGDIVSYEVTTPGKHEIIIWVREIGTVIDKILISGNEDLPPSITLAGAEIEAEDFTFTTEVDDVYSWEIVGDTLAPGMSNGLAIQASPGDSVESFKDDYEMLAASSSYVVNFEEAGTYYFFFRGNSLASGDKNSFHLGVSNGADTTTFERVEMDQDIDTWQWTNTLKSGDSVSYEVTTPGMHEIIIWVREIGTVIDKILISDQKDLVINAESVSLDQTTATIDVGATTQLTATVAPESATDKSVTWSSSDDGIATVSTSGLVTGVAAGTATITVTTTDGSFTATAEITVQSQQVVNVTGVTVDPATSTIDVDATVQLTATVAPEGATDKSVTWSSSDDAIATVSNSGLVTGVAAGTATITVTTTDGSFTATAEITVTAATSVNAITAADFNVYPNPVQDNLFIEGEAISTLAIYSVTGKAVLKLEEITSKSVNVSGIESGMYFLKLTNAKGSVVIPLVKE